MLYIVATPIGNLEDISLRAVRILKEADVILAEDTRHTGLLLKSLEIPHKPFISFYEEVETQKMDELLALIASEQKVVLVSDAGTPLISDPGYKLVREAIKRGIKVESIPGPSAVVTALTVSGLPPNRFMFMGYPPEKPSHQLNLYKMLAHSLETLPVTVIFYVSPHKIRKTLELVKEVFGDQQIVLIRELTKVYEERISGTISEVLEKISNPQGEFVLLFNKDL
ncbi:16S rRNA (cytidine(1402)-2'-O)-methyltransferase [Patescibacteria group bacterium]|nr:16S rRNA (cytidine(1402)-2'-O)-methyltransferase [Patescibacteria group bacterium]